MESISQIVAGGGWKETRVERVKVKAWIALFGAIGLASLSILASDSIWLYACIPAGVSFLTSLALFVRERPREIQFPWGRVGHDLRNLHGTADSQRARQSSQEAEPGAAPNGGPATCAGDSGVKEGPPSVS